MITMKQGNLIYYHIYILIALIFANALSCEESADLRLRPGQLWKAMRHDMHTDFVAIKLIDHGRDDGSNFAHKDWGPDLSPGQLWKRI